MIQGNKRLTSESFKKYRERLKEENAAIKRYLRGWYIWASTDIRGVDGVVRKEGQGTYSFKKHGYIGRRAALNP